MSIKVFKKYRKYQKGVDRAFPNENYLFVRTKRVSRNYLWRKKRIKIQLRKSGFVHSFFVLLGLF